MSSGLDSQNGRWVGVARMAVGWLVKMGFRLVRWLTTMGYVSGGQNAGSDVCVAVFGVFSAVLLHVSDSAYIPLSLKSLSAQYSILRKKRTSQFTS